MTVVEALRAAAPTLSVGIAAADLLRLGEEAALLESTEVPLLHYDVMDGTFCPQFTFGPAFVKAVRTPLYKDVHLMVHDPLSKIGAFVAAGADIVTVQVESEVHVHRVFQDLGKRENANDSSRGIVRGAALNPGTPVSAVEPLLDELELVMLLAINPGWGGQKFSSSTPRRIEQARALIERSGRDVLICVDGGVTRDNIAEIAALGPDIVVTGSAVFDGTSPVDNAKAMLAALHG